MERTYSELSQYLIDTYLDGVSTQTWVCIAGGPGSGKSTLAAELMKRINDAVGDEVCVVLPMDGFHYSRKQLRHIAEDSQRKADMLTDSTTKILGGDDHPADPVSMEELLARRGAPWTFHVRALCSLLSKARQLGHGKLPVYSRQKSDPVYDEASWVVLKNCHKVVLVEGNYLLQGRSKDEISADDEKEEHKVAATVPDISAEGEYDINSLTGLDASTYALPLLWERLHGLWDEAWFVECASVEQQRNRLVKRHLETWTAEKDALFGPGEKGAGEKADRNDMLNAVNVARQGRWRASRIVVSVDE